MARRQTLKEKRTLKEIDAEIAKLQQEASEIRESEKAGVVAKMKDAITYYGITAVDLGLNGVARKGRVADGKAVKVKTKAAGRVKYRDDAGHTWSGFGRKPSWYTEALASGKTEADLRA